VARVRARVQELLQYFSVEYIKAYKTALVLSVRDAKNGDASSVDEQRPEFQLLLDAKRLPQPHPRLEGDVWVGSSMKDKQHWSMAKNYVVSVTDVKCGKEETPQSPTSPTGAGGVLPGSDASDTRVWLDDDCTDVCMNPACGEKFSLFSTKRHCRLCGEIYCKKCRDFRLDKENKFCEPCYLLRTSKDAPESQLPLLKKPEVRTKQISFMKYKVQLSDADLFAAAGASAAAAKAGKDDNNGKHVLVLTHRRQSRPQLRVGFDSIEQRDQWMSLLQTASWASPSPITTDPMLRAAFTESYRKLRWRAWVWTSWEMDGSEPELLTDILSEVLYREIILGEMHKMPDIARKMAVKVIYRVLVGAVSACWTSLMKSLPSVRGPLEKAAEGMLGPLFDKEKEIKEKIQQPMEDAANKGMDTAESKLQELFAQHMPVIAAAAEAQLNMIHTQLVNLVDEVPPTASAQEFDSKYEWMRWRCNWSWSWAQRPISVMLEQKLSDSSATRQLGHRLVADLTQLNQSAFVVLRQQMQELQGGGAAELIQSMRAAYPGIVQRAAADIGMLLTWRMAQALDAVLMPPLQEQTGKVVDTLCEPLNALIPDVLKDVLDPPRMCGEILQEVVTKTETELCGKLVKPVAEQAMQQAQTLASTGINRI